LCTSPFQEREATPTGLGFGSTIRPTLRPDHITIRWSIPVTNPSRTLQDLRRLLPQPQFRAALQKAEYLGLPIEAEHEPDHTRSELERRFLALCRRHRIRTPEVNARIGPFTVDFLWSRSRLIVEVDGYRSHGSRAAFERDRERDLELKLRGYEVLRFTWLQLAERGAEVAAALRQLLS
jgi:very-short-patch-repair endonuclease